MEKITANHTKNTNFYREVAPLFVWLVVKIVNPTFGLITFCSIHSSQSSCEVLHHFFNTSVKYAVRNQVSMSDILYKR